MRFLTPAQRRLRWAVAGSALIALLLPFLKNALPWFPYVPCIFKNLTGLPCLLCGGTRAACAAVRGEWAYSLYLNPVSIPILLALVIVFLFAVAENLANRVLVPWSKVAFFPLRLAPIFVLFALLGWGVHIYIAMKTPKSELVDYSKLPAARLREWFSHR